MLITHRLCLSNAQHGLDTGMGVAKAPAKSLSDQVWIHPEFLPLQPRGFLKNLGPKGLLIFTRRGLL